MRPSARHPIRRAGIRAVAAGLAQALLLHAALLAGAAAHAEVADQPSASVEDLDDIRWQRPLRVLLPPGSNAGDEHTVSREGRLLRRFAAEQFLDIDWRPVADWDHLIDELVAGHGDVIAAPLTITDARKRRIAFTVPLATVREELVVRAGDSRIQEPAELAGREIAMRERSSFWALVQGLRRTYPSIGVRLVPETTSARDLLAGVDGLRFDMAAVDRSEFERESDQWPDLRALPAFAAGDAVAWGVRREATALREALDRFLERAQLARRVQTVHKDDLPGIERRGVLRVLTRNNATTYYLWRGRQVGFEYELLRRFAREHHLRLEMIVVPSRRALIPTLLWGGGDVVAAGLTITDARRRLGVEFTMPYNEVREVLVARRGSTPIHRLADLAGRSIAVRRSSSYWATAHRLQHLVPELAIRAAPEEMETEEIIAAVADGEYDLTIADSHILGVELQWRDDVEGVMDVAGPVQHGWAVRKDSRELLAALNEYIAHEYRGLFYNVTYERYFENPQRIRRHMRERPDRASSGRLSPYDEMVRKHAEDHGLDWRLIVAQMFQESRFDPNAHSRADAQGLLQVLPSTAARFGITDLQDPDQAVEAGIRYLAWLRERFSSELSVRDRMWFALAAYNAGYDHVDDARRLAADLGLDPDRWFGNVEKAMRLLARPRYYRHARAGYVRGGQTVIYVRDIRDRYRAYLRLADNAG